jgi:peptidoglycan-associated lipoprotein
MLKKFLMVLAVLLVFPGLMFTVSCSKKAVKSDESGMTQAGQTGTSKASGDMSAEELAKQRAIEEERIRAQAAERQTEMARRKFVNEDIYFDFDSSAITDFAQEVLAEKAEWLRANPAATVVIEGHCDERGTSEYNLALGDRRANTVKNYLVNLGIASNRMRTISYGEERPADPRHTEEAWAKNRRAHFIID